MNERNRNNNYYLSTVFRLDESIDRYMDGVYEEIVIDQPLSKEAFLSKIEEENLKSREPKRVTLKNVTNFPNEISQIGGHFSQVTYSFSGKNHRLMFTHQFDLKTDVKTQLDPPFIIISDGKLGLISNVLEFNVRLITSAPPEEWMGYLPNFTEQIKEINGFQQSETVIHILSENEEFIYNSKYPNSLTTIVEEQKAKKVEKLWSKQ